MGFKFELKTVDGDDAGSFESAVPNWQTGDTLIAAGNVRYRVVSVIPAELVAPTNLQYAARRTGSLWGRVSGTFL